MSYRIEQLSFRYGPSQEALIIENLSLDFNKDKITCILGPSGCGKTTLLKLLAGMLQPLSGSVGEGFNADKVFIFQEPRLMPWLTAYENMAFVLPDDMEMIEKATKIQTSLSAVELWSYRDYFPEEMSGGMKQRIALARGFLKDSNLMLMDEPLKSLDVQTKVSVINAFKALWKKEPRTVVMVTHDALDAALLADEIIILSEKPTHQIKALQNPIEANDRVITHPSVGHLQSELYQVLLQA